MSQLRGLKSCGVFVVLGMVALAAAQESPAPPASQPADAQPRLELSANDFDFGEVWQGMPPEREFTVKNVGDAPLTLNLRTTCGCTAASKPKSPLSPGESTAFTIRYDARRPGPASKKVIISTNDPQRRQAIIPVHGTVKALINAKPVDRIALHRLDADAHESASITLESGIDKPLHLKLHEGQQFDHFEIELKEIEPGRKFELRATTVPPLRHGTNRANVVLDTGLEEVPTYTVPVFASVQPRVSLSPSRLYISSDSKWQSRRTVNVQYKVSTPIRILDVKSSHDNVTYELRPPMPIPEGGRFGSHQILLTLPPFDELPDDGVKVDITTDDEDPQFQHLVLTVVKRQAVQRRQSPGATSRPAQRYPIPGARQKPPQTGDKPKP